eukprot:CAMPEP_0185725546 /NCGR_PEP_ID=MMETSP1171-20130828/1778_1 /TAXON_ID=374046 /ORGANISM="Helicotheca tamensis, Strain CCMP826" /LENGTH=523 /DNA_ID=CAMNT_0028393697 /DNA_START=51 /DNA_END=1622 /DNA_ORIENTATION=+
MSQEVKKDGNGGGGGGGCPMKLPDGGYSWNPLAYFGGKKNPHLSGGKTPLNDSKGGETAANATGSDDSSKSSSESASSGGCPVKSNKNESAAAGGGGGGGGCPVKASSSQEYNVYSQPIDPSNQMPSSPHSNLPSPFQQSALSTSRVSSNIPKGGTEDGSTWTYPSPQMFYNSLVRKNKLGDDTTEEDMDSVVALHNNMNEKTWHKVMQWEDILTAPQNAQQSELGGGAKLSRFQGRPSDLSPKAYFKHYILGHPLPFDRHDWVVLRPHSNTEQRYVIDYYYDESRAKTTQESATPHLTDFNAVQSILVDVRPALDGWQSMLQRAVLMPLARRGIFTSVFSIKSSEFTPLPLQPTSNMKTQVGESLMVWETIQNSVKESKQRLESKSMLLKKEDIDEQEGETEEILLAKLSKEEAEQVATNFSKILQTCTHARKLMNECTSEDECAKASLSLTTCMASIVCPVQHSALVSSLNVEVKNEENEKEVLEYNGRVEAALENVATCVQGNDLKVQLAKRDYPELFGN